MINSQAIEKVFCNEFGPIKYIDEFDGLRITFTSEEIVHLRPSRDKPVLRCYCEAETEERANYMKEVCLDKLSKLRNAASDVSDAINVFGCSIKSTDFEGALESVYERTRCKLGGYVCFVNVHSIMTSMNDSKMNEALNNSFMSVPDGRPIYWAAKKKSADYIQQVSGPDFMPKFINRYPDLTHFFYGSTDQVLESLIYKLKKQYPGMRVAGKLSPPFHQLTSVENQEIIKTINEVNPDVIWVGLGAPKQEYWMYDNSKALGSAVLLGVGAAFDFHAGSIKRAPKWMRACGLEWFHRLCSEPRRLWRRYLTTNSRYMIRIFMDRIFKIKR